MLLYLSIFNIDRVLRSFITGGILFQSFFYSTMIGLGIASIVSCVGPSQLANQFCQNYAKPVTVLNAAVNVLTDIYVLPFPEC